MSEENSFSLNLKKNINMLNYTLDSMVCSSKDWICDESKCPDGNVLLSPHHEISFSLKLNIPSFSYGLASSSSIIFIYIWVVTLYFLVFLTGNSSFIPAPVDYLSFYNDYSCLFPSHSSKISIIFSTNLYLSKYFWSIKRSLKQEAPIRTANYRDFKDNQIMG